MKTPKLLVRHDVVFAVLIALSAGCQNNTQRGAAIGTGLGALTGAIIGHQSGNKEAGAVIGAVTGGMGGALLGNAKDAEEERDAAVAYANHQQMARQAERRAVTNADVINLSRKGHSDQLIISTMRHRGGRFDTSPDAQIYLKEQGVSEAVIEAMMRYTAPY